jgi:HEAT repeat protein
MTKRTQCAAAPAVNLGTHNNFIPMIVKTMIPLIALFAAGSTLAAIPNQASALAVLASDAGIEEKARACQHLAAVGGPDAVPVLAAFLADEKLAAHARSGLENIKDPAAGEALRKALPLLSGRLLAGVVTSLGARREAAAVPDLEKLLADPSQGAALPVVAALGEIASTEAAKLTLKILKEGPPNLRIPAAHAALVAAARLGTDGRQRAAVAVLEAVRAAELPDHIKAAAAKDLATLKNP